MLDRESGVPYYWQIMNELQRLIEAGVLKEGDLLPSARDLGQSYGVNRHTVRQAVDELCRQGVLGKVKGRGTFVGHRQVDWIDYPIALKNQFGVTIAGLGYKPGTQLRQATEIPAPQTVAEWLGYPEGVRVYELSGVRLVDGRPFLTYTTYLLAAFLPGFMDHLDDFRSLSSVLLEHYGILLERVKTVVRAALPSTEQAQELAITPNVPVLQVENRLRTAGVNVLGYVVSCYRGDVARLNIDWLEETFHGITGDLDGRAL